MLHRTKRAVLTLTFGFLAMMVCAPVAFGQAVITDMQLTDQIVTNECNGEPVLLNGTLHQEMSFSTNPNGNTHSSFNDTIHMNGYGQVTGVLFVSNEIIHNEYTIKVHA